MTSFIEVTVYCLLLDYCIPQNLWGLHNLNLVWIMLDVFFRHWLSDWIMQFHYICKSNFLTSVKHKLWLEATVLSFERCLPIWVSLVLYNHQSEHGTCFGAHCSYYQNTVSNKLIVNFPSLARNASLVVMYALISFQIGPTSVFWKLEFDLQVLPYFLDS